MQPTAERRAFGGHGAALPGSRGRQPGRPGRRPGRRTLPGAGSPGTTAARSAASMADRGPRASSTTAGCAPTPSWSPRTAVPGGSDCRWGRCATSTACAVATGPLPDDLLDELGGPNGHQVICAGELAPYWRITDDGRLVLGGGRPIDPRGMSPARRLRALFRTWQRLESALTADPSRGWQRSVWRLDGAGWSPSPRTACRSSVASRCPGGSGSPAAGADTGWPHPLPPARSSPTAVLGAGTAEQAALPWARGHAPGRAADPDAGPAAPAGTDSGCRATGPDHRPVVHGTHLGGPNPPAASPEHTTNRSDQRERRPGKT